MIKNEEDWLIHQMAVRLLRRTCKGWRSGLTRSHEVQHRKMHGGREGSYHLDSSFAKKYLMVLVANKSNMIQQCTLAAKRANKLIDCIRKSIVSRPKVMILPLCSASVRHSRSTEARPGIPSRKRTMTYWNISREGLQSC